jgi:hypothetical protein
MRGELKWRTLEKDQILGGGQVVKLGFVYGKVQFEI